MAETPLISFASPILLWGVFHSHSVSSTHSGECPPVNSGAAAPSVSTLSLGSSEFWGNAFPMQSWQSPSSSQLPLLWLTRSCLSLDELLQLEVAQPWLWESAVPSHLTSMRRFFDPHIVPLVASAAGAWSFGLKPTVFSPSAPLEPWTDWKRQLKHQGNEKTRRHIIFF